MAQYNMPYDNLPVLAQMRINAREDIKVLDEAADERTVQIGDEESLSFLKRRRDRNDAWFSYIHDLQQAQKAVDDGVYSGYDFRLQLQKARYGYGKMLELIDRNPDYAEALKKIKERDVSGRWIGDTAYDELMEWIYTEGEDEYGIFRYNAYNQYLDQMRIKYGDAIMAYVDERRREKNKELPLMAQEYLRAVDVLKPYWQVQDEVIRIFGQPKTPWQERRVDSLITKVRKQLRRANPEMERFYQLFYVQS